MTDATFAVTTCNGTQERLRSLYSELRSWQAVADKFGVSKAMAYRVAVEGYEPKDPALRTLLELPPIVTVYGRLCACGCGEIFAPKSSRHAYVDRKHRWRADYRRKK